MLLLSLRGAVGAATEAVDQPGTYELAIAGLDPAVHLRFAETGGISVTDSSGHGRSGTLKGVGATLGRAALAPDVGSSNKALNLGSAAWVEIPHNAVDTELTFSTASPWDGNQDGYRFIADCLVSIWFQANSLPTGGNRAVIVAKSSSDAPGAATSYAETHPILATAGTTVSGGSFEAYLDSNGAVHVEVRSFRGRPVRIRTPDGAVSTSTAYHLAVQLGYDGVAAWLDGAKFEDGYANPLHVYGLAADIRGIIFRNDYAWTIGKAAWGGQADLIVDEFALYPRTPNATITQAEVSTLAQQEASPAALAHHIWGQRTVNASGFASIQAAVNNVNSLGGGTVLINPGTYNENVELKSNVRLKKNGTGTVTITGAVSTALPSYANLTDDGGDFLTGDRNLDVSNGRSVGDVVKIMGTAGNPSPMRLDRRWNTTAESNDPNHPDGEAFLIESRNANSMTFEGIGTSYDFAAGDRQNVRSFTPVTWVGIEDISIIRTAGIPLRVAGTIHARFVNVIMTADAHDVFHCERDCIYVTLRNCSATLLNNVHVGHFVFTHGLKDCVAIHCTGKGRDHTLDVAGNNAFGPSIRIEGHDLVHVEHTIEANRAKIGTHGSAVDCIWWNCVIEWGGVGVSGWKHDVRWVLSGSGGSGTIMANDGLGDSYLRDIFVDNPDRWFSTVEGVCGYDRNHLENIRRSGTVAGSSPNVHGLNYGTGADANTYSNVDAPHANWTEV